MTQGTTTRKTALFHEEGAISIAEAMRALGKYRGAILLILAAIATIYISVATFAYITAPTVRTTRLNFSLAFEGAEVGEYPNGTQFSTSDILSAPVLARVFENNEMNRFLTLEDLKDSVFIIQTSDAFEALEREYRAKLADPKLSPVDRGRLEQEYLRKRESINQSGYAVTISTSGRINNLPSALQAKILNDLLNVWAEKAIKEKGVLLYDISVFSSEIFKRDLAESRESIVALDLIRTNVNRVIRNIDELLDLPGTSVLRTNSGNASLAELRVRLEDIATYRAGALQTRTIEAGLPEETDAVIDFFGARLHAKRLELMEARATADVIATSLQTYVEQGRRKSFESTSNPLAPSSGTVIPQLDESFLDRIVQLTGESSDQTYRQKMVDEFKEASLKVVPLEAEVRYYEDLLESLQRSRKQPVAARANDEYNSSVREILNDAMEATDAVNEIYRTFSANLHPSTALFRAGTPVSFSSQKSVSARTLAIAGFALILVSIPAILIAVLVFDQYRAIEGDGKDD